MSLEAVGLLVNLMGELLIAVSIFYVHNRSINERMPSEAFYRQLDKEKHLIMLGVALMIIGHVLQVPVFLR